jgi:hypothetical protein
MNDTRWFEGDVLMAPRSWLKDKRLKGVDLAVALVLASHANNETGICFPSTTTIARAIGSWPRTVTRSIRNLEWLGYLDTRQRAGKSSTYRMHETPDIAPSSPWVEILSEPPTELSEPPTELRHPTPDEALSPITPREIPNHNSQSANSSKNGIDGYESAKKHIRENILTKIAAAPARKRTQRGGLTKLAVTLVNHKEASSFD